MDDTAKHDPPETVKRKRGGQPGNDNGRGKLRHGLKAGKLPGHMQYLEHRANGFRRELENLVIASKQTITVTDAAIINTVVKWERYAAIAQHYMRHEGDKLSVTERLKFHKEIAEASEKRDKNLRLLGLDEEQDPWNVIAATNAKVTNVEDVA